MATNKSNSNIENEDKVVNLEHFISYELLKKLKLKEPDTKFILPNGREATLNEERK